MEDVNISKYRASVVRDGSKPASPGFVVSEGQDPVNPPGTNNYVPYSGATANVELGEYGVESGFITLDTTPTNTPVDQGTIYWDDSRSTAALIMNGTLQHIGQDTFFYVKNSSGSTIPEGTCVRFAGTDGASGHLLVAPFLADGTYPSSYFMGVTAEEIANGAFGQVMHFGELDGIDTSGYTAGDLLYASTTVAGAFQTTAPVAPNNIVLVAAAVNSKNNGAIIVRPQIGSNINNDEGVKITSPTTGDLLQLQAGGLWENKTIDGAGIVTKATSQVISGLKTFNVNTLMMQSSGNANAVYLSNSSGSSTYQSGFNFFGFNTDNHIYFAKSSITGGNTGILAWTNTATRTYTLKDASGTLAFTSDIPANPVGGTGTTNYLPKFTGTSTIGNSVIQDNGSLVSIGVATTVNGLIQSSISASGSTAVSLDLRNTVNALNSNSSMYFSVGSGSLSSTNITAIIRGIVTQASALKSDLTFFTNSGDSVIEAMRLTSSGNLGLGVTPSAWNSIFKVLQLQDANIFTFSGNPGLQFTTNAYFDTGFKYQRTAGATYYVMAPDSHQWHIAPSGTAGNAVSFTQAMTLNASGNLLVGTTSDNGARLQVSGDQTINATQTYTLSLNNTAQDVRMQFQVNGTQTFQLSSSSSQVNIFGAANIPMIFYTNSTERMRITSGGNVLIGTSSPSYRLVVNSGTDGISAGVAGSTYGIRFDNGGTFSSGMSTIHGVDSTLVGSYQPIMLNGLDVRFGTSANERMRITSSGEVLINTTTNSATSGVGAKFVSNGRLYTVSSLSDNTQESLSMYSTGAANYRFYVGWGGTIYATSTSISGISDISLKTNIRDLDKGLQDILQLKPRRFDWKNGDGKDNIGFVAQEIESIFPELISEYKYNQFETKKSLKMGDLIPSLVKAIQELKQEIDTLKN